MFKYDIQYLFYGRQMNNLSKVATIKMRENIKNYQLKRYFK